VNHPLTADDIQRIVTERIQETESLDFKRQLPDSGKNDDLAKAIAALANTAGGVLIYGIAEDADSRAEALAPVELRGCTERIALVAGTLDEPVKPTSIYTVQQAPGYGYVVVDIPLSNRAPHFHNGVAYGRTPKTTTTLSRRQIGELFARSEGFIDEFRLRLMKPGRLLVRGARDGKNTRVRFTNDGESDITDVDWTNYKDCGLGITIITGWPFPVAVLRPGQEVSQHVDVFLGAGPFSVRAFWRDSASQEHTEEWRVTF